MTLSSGAISHAGATPRFLLTDRGRGAELGGALARLLLATLLILTFAAMFGAPAVSSDINLARLRLRSHPDLLRPVWVIKDADSRQVLSNGLRIDNEYQISNTRRFYQVLERSRGLAPSLRWYSEPAGIVFHTTESPSASTPDQVDEVRHFSARLLDRVREERAYNFVIDRFGSVRRVVEELDAANHSGNSVWSHGDNVYLNLNNSFLAVAFEARTRVGAEPDLLPAQLEAGRRLVEFLRYRYSIPAANCITHAQVSVNPFNMRIGYHTDGASGFPFAALGLPDNYRLPLASISEFGFSYDEVFEAALGGRKWTGLLTAEGMLERAAAQAGQDRDHWRRALQERYQRLYASLKLTGALDEAPQAD